MPQIIECAKCATKLNAPDILAGTHVACPACQAEVSIPINSAPKQQAPSQQVNAPPQISAAGLSSAPAPSAVVIQCPHCTKNFEGSAQLLGKDIRCPVCSKDFTARLEYFFATARAIPVAPIKSSAPAPVRSLPFSGGRPRMLYLVFALAFVPLVFQTSGSQGDIEKRFAHTFAANPKSKSKLQTLKSKAELFALFPDGKIEGAHLSYFTHVHWAYAAIAAAAFFGVCWLLFDPGKATVAQWFIFLGVTGTIGVFSLLTFQWIADVTQGVWITGYGVLVLLFYIVKFIGFSYHAASDPNTNFWLSFLGFTCGVGLCEEITKALPVIVWLGEDKKLDWRAACTLGLASGIGFGVVEGIMYSGEHYNGIMSSDIYLTRFISCVALHATWTAAVCLMAVRNLSGFNTRKAADWAWHLLMIVSVPAVMHGLYDTLLKKGFDGYALAVAIASFAWLALMLELARSSNVGNAPHQTVPVSARSFFG